MAHVGVDLSKIGLALHEGQDFLPGKIGVPGEMLENGAQQPQVIRRIYRPSKVAVIRIVMQHRNPESAQRHTLRHRPGFLAGNGMHSLHI